MNSQPNAFDPEYHVYNTATQTIFPKSKSLLLICALSRDSRSCLLHRFVKNEWRVLSSQTIGVEFATKIIKVGTGARRKRIKLQVRPRPRPTLSKRAGPIPRWPKHR